MPPSAEIRFDGWTLRRQSGELALNPGLAEAHVRLALSLWSIGDSSAAAEHRRSAAALEPNHPLVLGFSADAAARDGRFDEAIELQRRAVARDPLSVPHREYLGYLLFFAGRLEEAKAEWLKVLELNPTYPSDIVGFVLFLSRQFDEALGLIQAWPESEDRTQCLALVYHGLGREADADAALETLIKSSRTSDPFRIAEVSPTAARSTRHSSGCRRPPKCVATRPGRGPRTRSGRCASLRS